MTMFCTISQSNAKQSAQMSTPKMAYAPGERETISYLSTRSRPFWPDMAAVLVGKWKIARVEFAYGHCGWPLVSGGSKGTMTFRLNSHNLIASAAHNAVPCRARVRARMCHDNIPSLLMRQIGCSMCTIHEIIRVLQRLFCRALFCVGSHAAAFRFRWPHSTTITRRTLTHLFSASRRRIPSNAPKTVNTHTQYRVFQFGNLLTFFAINKNQFSVFSVFDHNIHTAWRTRAR